jgi:predicted acylesterase/phospholipase RssA
MSRRSLIVLLLVGTIAIAGCAHYPLNAPLAHHTPSEGHRFPAMDLNKPDPADELFVCFSFSGGGTRAAAFAYGALVKLRDTNIGGGGAGPSLLDEVDCIAGISGGAFTAAYYGLFGAKQTFEKFHDVFLGRDIQGELALRAASPPNLWRLASPYFGRIDLAAELYDQTVFEGKTFAALPKRPFVILHATNMANGSRFEFTQDVFDFMGSDLAPLAAPRPPPRPFPSC